MAFSVASRVAGLKRISNFTYCAYVQHRYRSGRRTGGPSVKAVFDADGNKIETGKLSELKTQIEKMSDDMGRKVPRGRKVPSDESDVMETIKKYSMSNFPIKPGKSEQHKNSQNTAKQDESSQHKLGQKLATEQSSQAKQSSGNIDDNEDDLFSGKVPHYTKIGGWDKSNRELKALGKILTSRQARDNSDTVVLEGIRIIRDALEAGFIPKVVVFSRVKLLHSLQLDKSQKCTKLYHIPYSNIKMWTDLTTSPGVMAAFSKQEMVEGVVADSPLPFSLICDNIRSPDNLGAVIRCAAAAGVGRILVTKGCVDVWNSKVVRAAAGAHFLVPIVQDVGWDQMANHLPEYPQVLLADLVHSETEANEDDQQQQLLDELEAESAQEGYHVQEAVEEVKRDISYLDEELCERYKHIPLTTTTYSDFTLRPGVTEGVVVVGGETEGVSGAAYKYCHSHLGERIYVPLRNKVNSLNVISATSVVLYRLQQELLKTPT